MFSLIVSALPALPVMRGERLLGDASLAEEVNGTATTSTQSADDQDLDVLDASGNPVKTVTDVLDHSVLVRVRLQAGQLALSAVLLLRGKGQSAGGRSSETGVEAKGSDSALGLGVLEELEVVQRTLALGESSKHVGPSGLLLVTVGELDVGVGQRVAGMS